MSITRGERPVVGLYRGAREVVRVYRGARIVWEAEPPQVASVLTSYASGSGTLSFVEISGDSGAAYAWDDATHSLTVDEEIEDGN